MAHAKEERLAPLSIWVIEVWKWGSVNLKPAERARQVIRGRVIPGQLRIPAFWSGSHNPIRPRSTSSPDRRRAPPVLQRISTHLNCSLSQSSVVQWQIAHPASLVSPSDRNGRENLVALLPARCQPCTDVKDIRALMALLQQMPK